MKDSKVFYGYCQASPTGKGGVISHAAGLVHPQAGQISQATPGVTTWASIRQGVGRVKNSLPALAKNSLPLPEELNHARRVMQGTRLPAGYRYFPDRDREAYARFINWSMQLGSNPESWFGTYTFRDYIPEKRANIMIDRYLARMSEAVNNRGSRLRYVVATEWQQRDVIHFHALLTANGLGDLSRKRWEARWEHRGGGYARLYDAEFKAAPYLAKYLNKDRSGAIRWGGTWQGITAPLSLDPGPCLVQFPRIVADGCQAGAPSSASSRM